LRIVSIESKRRMSAHAFRYCVLLLTASVTAAAPAEEPPFRLATFSADVTIPIGHRCMGILPRKAERIDDPLEAHGFVLFGPD